MCANMFDDNEILLLFLFEIKASFNYVVIIYSGDLWDRMAPRVGMGSNLGDVTSHIQMFNVETLDSGTFDVGIFADQKCSLL